MFQQMCVFENSVGALFSIVTEIPIA